MNENENDITITAEVKYTKRSFKLAPRLGNKVKRARIRDYSNAAEGRWQ